MGSGAESPCSPSSGHPLSTVAWSLSSDCREPERVFGGLTGNE